MSPTPSERSDSQPTARPDSRPALGIFWMLGTGLCFVGVTAVVKIVGSDIPPAQSAFIRYVLGLVFLIPMIRPMLEARLTRRGLGLFGLRGAVHTGGVICWFYAMTQIPIAEVTAMNYLNPIYVTIMAALILGEKLAIRRILAICVALAGALLILRPGFRELNTGHLAMIFTAIFFAAGYLVAKIMTDETSPAVVVGMLSVTVTIGLAPFAWAVWVPVTGQQIFYLFIVAALATGGHYSMSLAFKYAPLSVTQPVTFLQLVWSTLLGAMFFAEPVDAFVVMGGGLIIVAISYISIRERMLQRQTRTPAVSQTKL